MHVIAVLAETFRGVPLYRFFDVHSTWALAFQMRVGGLILTSTVAVQVIAV